MTLKYKRKRKNSRNMRISYRIAYLINKFSREIMTIVMQDIITFTRVFFAEVFNDLIDFGFRKVSCSNKNLFFKGRCGTRSNWLLPPKSVVMGVAGIGPFCGKKR